MDDPYLGKKRAVKKCAVGCCGQEFEKEMGMIYISVFCRIKTNMRCCSTVVSRPTNFMVLALTKFEFIG